MSRSPASRTRRSPDRSIPITATGQRRQQIRADLKLISPYTHAIRTYSSTGGVELVPAIAAEFGLKVTLGIWIDKNEARNEREIQSAIALARRYSNINAIVVGNETTLRAREDGRRAHQDHSAREAAEPGAGHHRRNLERLDRTTGRRKLASAVDFIAAHILALLGRDCRPIRSVEPTIAAYNKLRRAHPGKRIVIAEFGWPSARLQHARAPIPGRIEQADGAARFRRARRGATASTTTSSRPSISRGRPTKAASACIGACSTPRATPSSPGAALVLDPDHWKVAGLAVLLGLLLSLPLLARAPRHRRRGGHAGGRRQCGRRLVRRRVRLLAGHYFVPGAAFALGLGVVLLIPLVADRARAHRGDRGDRVRTRPAPPDRRGAARARTASRRRCRSTFRRIASRRRCSRRRSMRSRGSTIRTSNAWSSSTTRPTRRSGGRSRIIAARSASASSSSTRTT